MIHGKKSLMRGKGKDSDGWGVVAPKFSKTSSPDSFTSSQICQFLKGSTEHTYLKDKNLTMGHDINRLYKNLFDIAMENDDKEPTRIIDMWLEKSVITLQSTFTCFMFI